MVRANAWVLAALLIAAEPAAAAPRQAHLLRDIFPGPSNAEPVLAGIVNGTLLFFATDEPHGRELWRSDGTADGTQLLRDIRPGPEGSIGYGGSAMVAGRLAFAASDGRGGAQLWSSDGTDAGTVLVRDAQPGVAAATVRLLTPAGERLWFTVQSNFYDQNLRGTEDLWVTGPHDRRHRASRADRLLGTGFSGGAAAVASLTPFNEGVLVARKDAFECCERTSLQNVDAAGTTIATLYQNDRGGHLTPLFPVIPFVAADTAYFTIDDWSGLSCGLRRSDGVATEKHRHRRSGMWSGRTRSVRQ
jgi:ELWxxDGT repeat protein